MGYTYGPWHFDMQRLGKHNYIHLEYVEDMVRLKNLMESMVHFLKDMKVVQVLKTTRVCIH